MEKITSLRCKKKKIKTLKNNENQNKAWVRRSNKI